MMEQLLDQFDCDTAHRLQALFSGIFIQQNRLQTACEKVQQEISMKQWLLLAMLECYPDPKTLSAVGKLMGCSRQNIKKLASALARQGYLTMSPCPNRSVLLAQTEKVAAYSSRMNNRRAAVMELLFADFSEEELAQYYTLTRKMYAGIERVEAYAREERK